MATINNNNGMFRKKRVFFTQVSNTAIRDINLSAKAKGLYSLIQSFITIENFILYKNTLKKYMMEGQKAFETMWKELKDKGYLIQYKLQKENGTFYYEYELLDEPNLELAIKVHAPKMAKTKDSIQTPKKEVVDKAPSGKVGAFNNTDFSNTDFSNTNSNRSSSIEEREEENIDTSNIKNKSKKINNKVVSDVVNDISKNNDNLTTLVTLCQNLSFKLKKSDMKSLLLTYRLEDISRAIMTITSTTTFEKNEIKNHRAYLVKTLNDINTIKIENKNITVNNTITNKPKTLAFNDYSQRETTKEEDDAFERQMLGWNE